VTIDHNAYNMTIPWIDAYKPTKSDEIIGQSEPIRVIKNYMENYSDGYKPLLLSGPSGVGKTLAVNLIAKEYDYDVQELNSSDSRNAKSILSIDTTNQVISFGGKHKKLILMEEIETMGAKELTKIVNDFKVPVILICNSHRDRHVTGIVKKCQLVKFTQVSQRSMNIFLQKIIHKEGKHISESTIEEITLQSNGDMRHSILTLDFLCKTDRAFDNTSKDKIHGFFEPCMDIMNHTGTLDQRYESFFSDYSMNPMMVYHNHARGIKDICHVDSSCSAASDADMIDVSGRWELLPDLAMMTVRIGSVVNRSRIFPEFPVGLGKMSKTNKRICLLKELSARLMNTVQETRSEYIDILKNILVNYVRDGDTKGCIEFIQKMNMTRDDLFEVIPEFSLGIDIFHGIPTKNKSAITRAYNVAMKPKKKTVSRKKAKK